jgi:hypothetical protein
VRLAALDHVEQAVAVEHLARMGEEGDEQAELGRGDRYDGAFGSVSLRFSGSSRQPSNS